MNGEYDVLSPWADVDPIPLRGISPRVTDLAGKTLGLFSDSFKVASMPILTLVAEKLKEKFPSLKLSWLVAKYKDLVPVYLRY
ncbi:MAG: hypothetical protein JRJ85_11415 [Deltaproteobacteria bacterium]|nr:hypothetical protein [Deltaproteobacteria bacterium]